MKKFAFSLVIFMYSLGFYSLLYSQPPGAQELFRLGKQYLEEGDREEAVRMFEMSLSADPSYKEPQVYLARIRRDAIHQNLNRYDKGQMREESSSSGAVQSMLQKPPYSTAKPESSSGGVIFKGQYQMGAGFTSDDGYWKRSDYNLNETNYRMLSDDGFNQRENTYDPAIFSFLRFDLDYPAPEEGWGVHSKFDISPWSFIGESDRVTVTSLWGDRADVELKYWANTGYTFSQTMKTEIFGNAFNLPELKVEDDKVAATQVAANWGDVFTIPELKIHRDFWPVRELNMYYEGDGHHIEIFPVALEDKAYTSDDPIGLSNHRTYWEESQWLTSWVPGNNNTGAGDYSPGEWDDSLAFLVRDAGNVRLTNLRGMSLGMDWDDAVFDFVIASPKTLWQDYDSFDTLNSFSRLKISAADNLTVGGLYGMKMGYKENGLDAFNHVWGIDANYGMTPETQLFFEVATSISEYDRKSTFEQEKKGSSYHISLIHSSGNEFGKNYFELNPEKNEPFYRSRFSFTRMDGAFESALSSHRFTRDDTFWGRHLTFRQPYRQFFAGLYDSSMDWYYVDQFRIGDGVDSGRDTFSFRYESFNLLDAKLDMLFDMRNVHTTDGAFLENVSRLETTYRATEDTTFKALGLYHKLPHTVTGVDPVMKTSDDFSIANSEIDDGQDPTLKTVSVGGEHWFTDWCAANVIWEHTNDVTLAYDNFPRGLLNGSDTSLVLGNYRYDRTWLYSQQDFPEPPYPYFDIFKVGFKVQPSDTLNIYLDWTRNEYEWAQIIDDNMNHVGLQVEYLPMDTLGMYFRYVYSRMKDISELVEDGRIVKRDHHNFAWEARYRPEKDREFILQYGVGRGAYLGTSTSTPFGGDVPVLDTQHIVRLYYQQEF
ncbi:MAG: hypothetical protein JXD21_03355 [Candidatus Omnitrophica bacterium]|nr:hypothetical protein [Candidatus Omnitrophota bacterium]